MRILTACTMNTPTPRQIIMPFNLRESPEKFLERENLSYRRVRGRIASVPCYFTNDPNDRGPLIPIFHRSRSDIAISHSMDLRDNEAAVDLIFDLSRDFFVNVRIPITEIQFWGRLVIIVLGSNTGGDVLRAVPKSIARCQCFYRFESEIGRPTTLLTKEADPRTIDETQYDSLRPGILLSSGPNDQEEEKRTSSGVLIRDQQGVQFMTASSYGFTSPGQVYHPNSSGQAIGEVTTKISNTDIALVKLNEGVNFANDLHSSSPFALQPFIRAAETRLGDPVFFNAPFTGLVTGTKMAHSLRCIPTDNSLEPEKAWMRCSWNYMGQNSNCDMAEGFRGSAIWNEEHRVLGFFLYAPAEGLFGDYCLSIAADHLLEKGYTVVKSHSLAISYC